MLGLPKSCPSWELLAPWLGSLNVQVDFASNTEKTQSENFPSYNKQTGIEVQMPSMKLTTQKILMTWAALIDCLVTNRVFREQYTVGIWPAGLESPRGSYSNMSLGPLGIKGSQSPWVSISPVSFGQPRAWNWQSCCSIK